MSESPFNGYWKLDYELCQQWDFAKNAWIPDLVDREDLRLWIKDDIYDWDMWVGTDPAYRMVHTSVIDGGWAPYMCRDIVTSTPQSESDRPDERAHINLPKFVAGQPTAYIKIVKINETFMYRISKSLDGKPSYVLTTEVIDDGERIEGWLMTPGGQVLYHRVLRRSTEF